jgi:hypothetical protein
MATWKKVIVSGSNAILNQLNVSTNQQIGTTQAATFLTGSFNGSFTGDGAGLTGVGAGTVESITAGTGLTGGTITGTGTIAIDTSVVATLASPTFTGTVGGITKAMVGLGSVDNTTDAGKPVSTAQQTALNLKANLASPTFTGTVGGITKSMVGLGSVDNTTDAAKPVSTAQQTALNLKANLASPTFTGTVGGITKAMVGLGNVDNTADSAKPVSTAQQTALNLKANLASPTFTGTVGGITKAMVGLGNVTNTSDANKPVSTAQQTALNLKANLASPTFTGTVTIPAGGSITAPTGLVKGDVGLGNVDNTADSAKPVSTATQTALNLKANLASPTFTGTVSAGSGDFSGDLTVDGDLVVNGDLVTLNTANLAVEDRFILLNSGSSTANEESGIIFGGANGTANSGTALIWKGGYQDASSNPDGRLAITNILAATATTATPSYYIAGVYEGSAANAATAQADHKGNIRIEGSDIYIFA